MANMQDFDEYYSEFKDDMMTETYERNCIRYGKETVDSYLAMRDERNRKFTEKDKKDK